MTDPVARLREYAGDGTSLGDDVAEVLAELDRLRANVAALLAHCDQLDGGGYSPIVAMLCSAAVRGFLDGHHVGNPHDDL